MGKNTNIKSNFFRELGIFVKGKLKGDEEGYLNGILVGKRTWFSDKVATRFIFFVFHQCLAGCM